MKANCKHNFNAVLVGKLEKNTDSIDHWLCHTKMANNDQKQTEEKRREDEQ